MKLNPCDGKKIKFDFTKETDNEMFLEFCQYAWV